MIKNVILVVVLTVLAIIALIIIVKKIKKNREDKRISDYINRYIEYMSSKGKRNNY